MRRIPGGMKEESMDVFIIEKTVARGQRQEDDEHGHNS